MKVTRQTGKGSIAYGKNTINYDLFYCNRSTMEIAVHPEATVIVKAPLDSDTSLIEKKIKKRARWILKQQHYFKQFNPRTPARCYVNGETHLYLGKQYRLNLRKGSENSVKLSRGFFHITSRDAPTPEMAKNLLNKWYREKAQLQFKESLERCWQKFNDLGFTKPSISIKRMQKRWGSFSDKGRVILNTDLIRAPNECIDYVVMHELCHLKHNNHSPKFYNLLSSLTPSWEKVKHKLELSMV